MKYLTHFGTVQGAKESIVKTLNVTKVIDANRYRIMMLYTGKTDDPVGFIGDTLDTLRYAIFCTIDYVSAHGETPESKLVFNGYILTAEDLPTLYEEGYAFRGWDKPIGYIINENTTITATWVRCPMIMYISEYGTPPPNKYVEPGYALTAEDLPTLVEPGLVFVGWDKPVGYIVNENTTITATWSEGIRITYDRTHGTGYPEDKNVEPGYVLTAADLPLLTDPDYIHLNGEWNKAIGDVLTSDTLLIPNWAAKSYVIIYKGAEKLKETESTSASEIGLHVHCFNANITSHTFNIETGEGTIMFDNIVTEIKAHAFRGCTETEIVIPATVTTLGAGVFYQNSKLVTANLPAVVTIGSGTTGVFERCYSLINLNLGTKLKSIGSYTFTDCKVLESIDFPATMETIANYAFYRAIKLKQITCRAITVPTLGSQNYLSTVKNVYVPGESLALYKKATNWAAYKGVMSAISE